VFYRCVNEFFNFREGNDAIKLTVDIFGSHSQDCTVEINILAACQLPVKTGAYFQKGTNPSIQICHARGWFRNTRENLKQSAFTGSVSANDTHYFAWLNLKADILESPHVSIFFGGIRSSTPENTKWRSNSARNGISQRTIGLLSSANGVPFGNSLGLYRNRTH
jgi:hypothetical protein